jgi:hypothetical protein
MINILNNLKTMSEYDEETGNVSLFIGVDINK